MSTRTISTKQMIDKVKRAVAISDYQRFNDDTKLEKMDVSKRAIKRKGGRPPALKLTNEEIVQLVFKQKWQAGKSFTNANGGDLNPCFLAVAEHHKVNVSTIREAWKKTPARKRKDIERYLVRTLLSHNAIHTERLLDTDKLLNT